jgi:molybdate transport system regulatory protein
MADKPELRVQVRIVPLIGPGKMRLLEAIDRLGSISAAARAVGMAYPNAWKLVDSLNRHFREPLVERVMGGRRGGGASLTDTGRAVLGIYRSVEAKARIMFAGDIDALSLLLSPDSDWKDDPAAVEGRHKRAQPPAD